MDAAVLVARETFISRVENADTGFDMPREEHGSLKWPLEPGCEDD